MHTEKLGTKNSGEDKNFIMKVCIIGANGRMGQLIIKLIQENKNPYGLFELVGKINSDTSIEQRDSMVSRSDIIIDFSTKEALHTNLPIIKQYQTPTVLGVTGLGEKEWNLVKSISSACPILYSANTSFGIAALRKLVKVASEIFLSEDNSNNNNYTVELLDEHHQHKKDSPSGTALSLLDEINKITAHNNLDIKISSKREGEIIGNHSIIFHNNLEQVELTHRALDRILFADGALRCAAWLYNNKQGTPGLYSMDDVLCV